jgi:hypothetical protein
MVVSFIIYDDLKLGFGRQGQFLKKKLSKRQLANFFARMLPVDSGKPVELLTDCPVGCSLVESHA